MPELFPDQQVVSDRIVKFYNSFTNNFLLLEGWAGVGKTFTIQHAIKELQTQHPTIRIAFTAPTHKAVKVIRNMALDHGLENILFKTIHSSLGLILNSDQEIKRTIKVKQGAFEDMDLVVIDEVSMLTREIVLHIKSVSQALNIPVILMGDSFQIPPVKEQGSPAFELADVKLKLTKIRRQEQGNPILELAAALREDIQNGTDNIRFKSVVNTESSEGVYALKGKDWVQSIKDNFIAEEYKTDPDYLRCIAWHNYRVDSLNRSVRKLLVGDTSTPYTPGERLITRQPIEAPSNDDYAPPLAYTDEECEVVSIEKTQHPKYLKTSVQFDVWEIDVLTPRGDMAQVHLLCSEKDTGYWKIFHKLKDAGNYRQWHAFQESFANLQPPHALTAHRSQGSTYKNVYLDLIDCYKNPNILERKKLLYVACSRASDNLILLVR